MLERALEKLNEKERYLIVQLFYFGRTERSLSAELGVSQYTVNRNKHKILKKPRDKLGSRSPHYNALREERCCVSLL